MEDSGGELTGVPLQAVFLADSFEPNDFWPISLERTLANIDVTLIWLDSVGVDEVFVLFCADAEQVIHHLETSEFIRRVNLSITPIEYKTSGTGDALRFISDKNLIRGDFVLVSGDTDTLTVGNLPLAEAVRQHRERNAILTILIKPSSTDEPYMAIHPDTKQLLYYDDEIRADKGKTLLPETYHHKDKQDCYIDICSPELLVVFAKTLHYQHLRHHFVKGLLDDEIMGYKVYAHEIHSANFTSNPPEERGKNDIVLTLGNFGVNNHGLLTLNSKHLLNDTLPDRTLTMCCKSDMDGIQSRFASTDKESKHSVVPILTENVHGTSGDHDGGDISLVPCLAGACVLSVEELMLEILTRLPLKSIFRFQAVSKSWCSTLTGSFFRQKYFKAANLGECRGLFLFRKLARVRSFSYAKDVCHAYDGDHISFMRELATDLDTRFRHIKAFNISNGLIAVGLKRPVLDKGDIYVYNPLTRHQTHLLLREDTIESELLDVVIDYDVDSGSYKVVSAWYDTEGPGIIWFKGFDSQCFEPDHYWLSRGLGDLMMDPRIVIWRGVAWNGCFYWITMAWVTFCFCFGRRGSCYERIKAPNPLRVDGYSSDILFFGVCAGELCAMGSHNPMDSQSLQFSIFRMEPDHSRWTLRYSVNLSPLHVLYPAVSDVDFETVYDDRDGSYFEGFRRRFSVLTCLDGYREDRPRLMISLPGRIIDCTMDGEVVRSCASDSVFRWHEAFPHFDTFASVELVERLHMSSFVLMS